MDNFSSNTLEYEKMLALVGRNAQTPMGKARFAQLKQPDGDCGNY
jgi:hypothetical protein